MLKASEGKTAAAPVVTENTAAAADMQKPVETAAPGVEFRDKEYKSRTIVLPDGSTVPVAKSRVTVNTPELIEYFGQRSDFERVPAAEA